VQALYWYTKCHYAECHYAEYHYAECHYAECHYTECHYADKPVRFDSAFCSVGSYKYIRHSNAFSGPDSNKRNAKLTVESDM